MHPNRGYAWANRGEMLSFVQEVSFATIFVAAQDGPRLVHTPVVVTGADRLRFHVSRANKAVSSLHGARALLSCLGPDGYISPDWYGSPDEVPTWNYVAVECEGPLRQIGADELASFLDDLSAAHESRLMPKRPWTRAKMTPGRFEGMLKAIVGFEMILDDVRGTRKLGQHKGWAERHGAAEGAAASGRADLAALMRPEQ